MAPRFTRRHARALGAGAATTLVYLAGGRLADSRAFRGSALLTVALAGLAYAEHASSVAKSVKKRMDAHVAATAPAVHFMNSGGTVGGPITCTSLSTGGGSVSTGGGAINTSGGNITCGQLTTGASGISMGGSLVMNNHDAFTFGHITANQIGPGGDRAALGAGATLAQVQARCDFLLQQLEGANICY